MKKILTMLLVCIMFVCTACTPPTVTQDPTADNETLPTNPSTITEPTVPDESKAEYEKNYTMDEMLELKKSWNIESVFPSDYDNVQIVTKNDTNLKMSLSTTSITYEDACRFYKTYVLGKSKLNTSDTGESLFFSFEEDYVCRTIMIVKNKENIVITVNYSMDNVNKR